MRSGRRDPGDPRRSCAIAFADYQHCRIVARLIERILAFPGSRRGAEGEIMGVDVTHIKPRIGSVVHVEKSRLYDAETDAQVLELLEQRGVLVFPRIGLNDEEQLALTDRLGTRVSFTRQLAGAAADVYKVTLDPKVEPLPEYVQGT